MSRSARSPLLLACLLAVSGRAGAVRLSDLLAEAERESPALSASASGVEASRHRRPQVTARPDPELRVSVYPSMNETLMGDQRMSLELMQRLPQGAIFRLRGERADLGVAMREAEHEATRLRIRAEVARAWYGIWELRRSRDLTTAVLRLLEGTEQVARARYAAGKEEQGVLLKAQVELGELQDRLRSFDERESGRAAGLSALLGREAGTGLGEVDPEDVAERSLLHDLPGLRALAEASSPELAVARLRIAEAGIDLRLAERAAAPDLTFGIAFMPMARSRMLPSATGEDMVMATFGVNLPVSARVRAETRERTRDQEAARRSLDAAGRTLDAELATAWYDYRDAKRRISLYREGLVPKARQALEAGFTSYQSGSASFLDLVDSIRTALMFELALAESLAGHLVAIAELERLVGTGLEATTEGKAAKP